jgi:hypothetical protein
MWASNSHWRVRILNLEKCGSVAIPTAKDGEPGALCNVEVHLQLAEVPKESQDILHLEEKGGLISREVLVSRQSNFGGRLSGGSQSSVIDQTFTNSFILDHARDRYGDDANEVGCDCVHYNTVNNTIYLWLLSNSVQG